MKIGIDLDGVVFDFLGSFIPFVKAWCGLEVKREQIVERDWRFGPDPEETNRLAWAALREGFEPNGYASLDLMPGAIESLLELRLRGHDIYYVTARDPGSRCVTVQTLHKLGILFDEKNLHFADGLKVSKTVDLGLRVMIEDTGNIAEAAADALGAAILFDTPYNQTVQDDRIARVRTWSEALWAIRGLESRRTEIPGQLGFSFGKRQTT